MNLKLGDPVVGFQIELLPGVPCSERHIFDDFAPFEDVRQAEKNARRMEATLTWPAMRLSAVAAAASTSPLTPAVASVCAQVAVLRPSTALSISASVAPRSARANFVRTSLTWVRSTCWGHGVYSPIAFPSCT